MYLPGDDIRSNRPAATASAVSNRRVSRPKPRSEARASSPLTPRSTNLATTSDALTAEMIPPLKCHAATSAPFSSNAIASSAELSKTTLILLPTWLVCPPGTDRRCSRPASCNSACGPGSVEPRPSSNKTKLSCFYAGRHPAVVSQGDRLAHLEMDQKSTVRSDLERLRPDGTGVRFGRSGSGGSRRLVVALLPVPILSAGRVPVTVLGYVTFDDFSAFCTTTFLTGDFIGDLPDPSGQGAGLWPAMNNWPIQY